MRKTQTPKLMVLVLSCFIFIVSCSNQITSEDIDKISLELIEQEQDPHGMIYTLKLTNGSNHVIKQNNVYLYFPIKTKNGSKSNQFKIEANSNKLDIKPGESLLIHAFASKEMYECNNNIDIENPVIQIKGYINEVTQINHFGKSEMIKLK